MVSKTEYLNRMVHDNDTGEDFTPYCHVHHDADALTVYFEDEADYSKRLNDHITLYLALSDDRIVGCRIKGIKWILDNLPNYIRVKHNGVELSVVFFAFVGNAAPEELEALQKLAEESTKRSLQLSPSD